MTLICLYVVCRHVSSFLIQGRNMTAKRQPVERKDNYGPTGSSGGGAKRQVPYNVPVLKRQLLERSSGVARRQVAPSLSSSLLWKLSQSGAIFVILGQAVGAYAPPEPPRVFSCSVYYNFLVICYLEKR
jgi:hypothetical protein